MKCQKCSGAGYIYNNLVGYTEDCFVCHGKGELLTNEEWFCQLPTDEKAQWLENKMTWAAQEQGTFTAKGWVKWLKQPHHEKE